VILRIVLAIALTTALLAVALPAMSVAAADRTDSAIDRQMAALGESLGTMTATDDPTVGPGARHVAEIRLPARTLTSAGVNRLRLYTRESVALASWRVGDGGTNSARLAGLPLRADGGELTLREAGVHRLVFGLRSRAEGPVLTVRRLGGRADA